LTIWLYRSQGFPNLRNTSTSSPRLGFSLASFRRCVSLILLSKTLFWVSRLRGHYLNLCHPSLPVNPCWPLFVRPQGADWCCPLLGCFQSGQHSNLVPSHPPVNPLFSEQAGAQG
jgi:hypothetical protein